MDIQQAYYEWRFEIAFLREKGDGFEALFDKLMGLAYKGDYIPTRPWGRDGDRKNDGYLRSERRLFQVYAPNELKATNAISKMTEDFAGAKKHWEAYFDKWVFVHNADQGLPPHVVEKIVEIAQNNPEIEVSTWSWIELIDVFRRISVVDKEGWFGLAPTEATKSKIGFADLKIVLESIADRSPPLNSEVRDVPAGKIEANALSESVATLLRQGMTKTQMVDVFLSQWHDESLGERIAGAFNSKYLELKEQYTPNAIFTELQTWAGGEELGSPEHQLAVLTILAYYFESCEIFEEPKGATQ